MNDLEIETEGTVVVVGKNDLAILSWPHQISAEQAFAIKAHVDDCIRSGERFVVTGGCTVSLLRDVR